MAVGEWFHGRPVLLTGATGFLGKVLLTKLLADTRVPRIYLLVRSKRGIPPTQRLQELLQSPILRKWATGSEDRLVLVESDLAEEGLGLSAEWTERLRSDVAVFIHTAASVKFNDPLSVALESNVVATKRLLHLATSMLNLQVFVHVSTAYSNCNRLKAEEKYYPPSIFAEDLLKIKDKLDSGLFEILSKKIINDYPNTYTFSKSLAEDSVWRYKDAINVTIVRPSVVVSAWREPEPGWSDSVTGVAALLVGGAKGVLQAVLCNPDAAADYVPVDVVARAIIVAAWHTASTKYTVFKEPIFNITAMEKMLSNRELMELSHKFLKEHPVRECVWNPSNTLTTNETFYTLTVWVRQLIPALIIDSFLRLIKQKPKLLRLQRSIYLAMLAIGQFTTKMWEFDNTQLRKLNSEIPEEDRDLFDLDMENIDLESFVYDAFMAGKKYILKEDPGWEKDAKDRAKRLFLLDKSLQAVAGGIIVWLILKFMIFY